MNGGYCLSTYQTGDVLCACQDGYTGMRVFFFLVGSKVVRNDVFENEFV